MSGAVLVLPPPYALVAGHGHVYRSSFIRSSVWYSGTNFPWDPLPVCTKLYGVTLLKTVLTYRPCNVTHYCVVFVLNFAFPSAQLNTCHELSAVCTTSLPLVESQLLSARQRSSKQATADRLWRRKRRHCERQRREDHINADVWRSVID